MRPFFLGSLDMFLRYQRMEEAAIGGGSQQGVSLAPGSQQQQQQQPARQLRQGRIVR